MVFYFLAGPGHRHRIERKAGRTQNKQRGRHHRLAQHAHAADDDHKHLNAQHQQTTIAIRQPSNRPLPQNTGADHHRHPETDAGVADAAMVKVQRHQPIQRAQHDTGDNAAVDAKACLTKLKHRPDARAVVLLFILLIQNTGKQQRQNTGQHHTRHQRQNRRHIRRQSTNDKLTQHGADVIHHHVSRQQPSAVARGAAAHQRALDNHPDHRAADARDKAPEHPAPEAHHKAQPHAACGENQRRNVVAEVEAKALNEASGQHRTDQVAGKIGRADHPHLPGRQVFMGEPERDERV